jgi:hypothetical protein
MGASSPPLQISSFSSRASCQNLFFDHLDIRENRKLDRKLVAWVPYLLRDLWSPLMAGSDFQPN